MPSARQITVSVPSTVFDNGKSDTISQRASFGGSPIYDGSYSTDEQVRAAFEQPAEYNATEGTINDGGHTFGTVKVHYQDSPNLEEINATETGGGGKPGTAWAPNIASPTEGLNPASIPEIGRSATINERGSGGFGVGNGLTSPSATAPLIARRRIGDALGFGTIRRI
jgi:hypothetical protein